LTPALQGQKPQQLGKIVGSVRVLRGDFTPVAVLITLEFRGAPIDSLYTDGQGRFGFSNLIPNEYRVTINDDAYKPQSVNVNVNPEFSPLNIVNLTLEPRESKKKEDPLEGRVAGSNPYLIDPAEYYRRFPKKTLKEFDKGAELEKQGKVDDAIGHYEEAIAYSPDFSPAHNHLGSAYLSQQKFSEAQNQFEAAIRANQNDADAHFNLANVLLLMKRYDEATLEIEEGFKRQPVCAFGQFLRGSLYSHTARPELAEKSLRAALDLDPKMSQAYLQLVNLYLQQKRAPEAIAELEAYLKTFPDSPLSSKVRESLKRLQGEARAAATQQ
jgi:tetratricopeptide (TPR) repeat protein